MKTKKPLDSDKFFNSDAIIAVMENLVGLASICSYRQEWLAGIISEGKNASVAWWLRQIVDLDDAAFFLRYTAKFLNHQQLGRAAKINPPAAIIFASEFLTPMQFDKAIQAAPWFALKYVSKKLDAEQLKEIAKKKPRTALVYARELLSQELLNWCEKHKKNQE